MRMGAFLLAVCCLSLSPALSAQKYVPKKITFSGYSLGTQAELLAATGIKPGSLVGQEEMNAAAKRLVDTGLFSDVRFGFDGSELTFSLKPAEGAVPVFYQNFPWWDAKTLTADLESRVPLFHGMVVPESGLQAEVAAALTAMLMEKGLQATISSAKIEPSPTTSEGVEFHVDSPAVEIGEVKFAGLSPEWVEPVGAIQKAAAGQPFDEATRATLDTALRNIYHRQGYLDEAMKGFANGTPETAGGQVSVPVSATIDEGPQYRLASLKLSGDVLISPEEFAKRARIHAGDVANEELLLQTLGAVAVTYRAKGYLRANIKAIPSFDRAQHTVSYDIAVVPGDVYRMGKLEIVNLSDDKKALVLQCWALHPGDIFDATYAPGFLNKNAKTLHAIDGWSASYKQYEHEHTHIVDMVVTFQPGGPLK
jgi:outer membrane protein insertion porin family